MYICITAVIITSILIVFIKKRKKVTNSIIAERNDRDLKPLLFKVSRALNRSVGSKEELMEINPKDVEEIIGLGPMSMLEPSAKAIGWGTNEYWTQLISRGK